MCHKKLRKLAIVCLLMGAFGIGICIRYEEEHMNPDTRLKHVSVQTEQEIKQVAITFDDGPSEPCTEKLLDGLKERGVKASFFVIGMYAKEHPELIKRMKEEGHIIGNHTYHHVELTKLTEEEMKQELRMTNDVIRQITGETPVFARPPFGEWNKKKDFPEELIPVLWNVDPLDWKTLNTASVVNDIMKEVEDGDIILLHDSYPTSVDAALQCIDLLQKQGYQFVTVDELMFG